jgi:hypothetical protein
MISWNLEYIPKSEGSQILEKITNLNIFENIMFINLIPQVST